MNKVFYLENDTNLTFEEDSVVTIFLNRSDIGINYVFKNGTYKVLVFNNCNTKTDLCETGTLMNADVEINYIEVNGADFSQKTQFSVNEHSTLTINSTYLGYAKKYIHYDLFNCGRNSEIYINNNVVATDDSELEMIVEGSILKGSKQSVCMQKNKCLTMGTPKKAKVLPVLNIDENDVSAAHSLSSGTIDDETMFYLNSRGLTKKESLQLIIEGYLLPKEEFYQQFAEGEAVKIKCEEKVGNLCSM